MSNDTACAHNIHNIFTYSIYNIGMGNLNAFDQKKKKN